MCIDEGYSEDAELAQHERLGQPHGLESRGRARIEFLEITREIDDAGRIAVSPLDADGSAADPALLRAFGTGQAEFPSAATRVRRSPCVIQ